MDLAAARALLDGPARVVIPHTDADGLAAGAIVLRALGQPAGRAVLLGRGETPWTVPLPTGLPVILDWGVRPFRGPALVVDHHVPEATAADGQVVISGHGETPETTTAVLARRLCPAQPAWLAALGAVGDLGDAGFALPECAGAPKTAIRK